MDNGLIGMKLDEEAEEAHRVLSIASVASRVCTFSRIERWRASWRRGAAGSSIIGSREPQKGLCDPGDDLDVDSGLVVLEGGEGRQEDCAELYWDLFSCVLSQGTPKGSSPKTWL